jgi:hypothetical protein
MHESVDLAGDGRDRFGSEKQPHRHGTLVHDIHDQGSAPGNRAKSPCPPSPALDYGGGHARRPAWLGWRN